MEECAHTSRFLKKLGMRDALIILSLNMQEQVLLKISGEEPESSFSFSRPHDDKGWGLSPCILANNV